MAKVIVPTPLRQYAGKQASVDLSAATVGELLEKLTTEYSDLRRHLYTDDGKLRSFVNVYLNDEDIRYLEKENTAVKESDVVSIVPSIAGGVSPVAGATGLDGFGLRRAQPSGPCRWVVTSRLNRLREIQE